MMRLCCKNRRCLLYICGGCLVFVRPRNESAYSTTVYGSEYRAALVGVYGAEYTHLAELHDTALAKITPPTA